MTDTIPVCVTCGAHFPPGVALPVVCPICADERQWVPVDGQRWTTLAELAAERRNRLTDLGDGVVSIRTEPGFAIGQMAHLLRTPAGNVLWDCISLLDDATVEAVRALGGIDAIALSHPHFYTGMVEWSRRFGDAPVYVHADDADWSPRQATPPLRRWSGERVEVLPGSGVTAVRCGGHFPGAAVLHIAPNAAGVAGGQGALFVSDTISIVPMQGWVSFMWSFPNDVPLGPRAVAGIVDAVAPLTAARLYGGWPNTRRDGDVHAMIRRSADRYRRQIETG